MPALAINGYALPVALGIEEKWAHLGRAENRSFDGSVIETKRVAKRSWTVKTPPMRPWEADMLERILLGDGDAWALDDHLFSAKGLKPTQYPTPVTTESSTAADGLAVVGPKFNGGFGLSDTAITNILSANQRSVETNTTGFTAVDSATLTRDTTYKWTGSASLKVVTNATGTTRGGVLTDAVASTSTATWRGSAYVMATIATSVRLHVRNVTTATDGTPTTLALAPYRWYRIDAALAGVTSGNTLSIYIQEETVDSGITYYCDGLQLEPEVNARGQPHPWANASLTNVNSLIWSVDDFMRSATAMSFAFWQVASGATPTNAREFFSVKAGATTIAKMQQLTGTADFSLNTFSTAFTATAGASTARSTPVHWAVVIQDSPPSGTAKVQLFKNGALVTSGSPAGTVSLSSAVTMVIGGDKAIGLISDVMLLPFAVTSDVVAGWYSVGQSIAKYPRLIATGDFVQEPYVVVQAKLAKSTYKPYSDAGTWRNAARIVEFDLVEA